MDKAVVLEAPPDIRNLAVRACHEHNESTFFKTSETGGMSMHEYNMTKTHAEIYDAFTKQHVCKWERHLLSNLLTGTLGK